MNGTTNQQVAEKLNQSEVSQENQSESDDTNLESKSSNGSDLQKSPLNVNSPEDNLSNESGLQIKSSKERDMETEQ